MLGLGLLVQAQVQAEGCVFWFSMVHMCTWMQYSVPLRRCSSVNFLLRVLNLLL